MSVSSFPLGFRMGAIGLLSGVLCLASAGCQSDPPPAPEQTQQEIKQLDEMRELERTNTPKQ
jgi:hypothetical protein